MWYPFFSVFFGRSSSCGKFYQKSYVVGLILCLVRRAVALDLTALGAFVDDNVALFGIGLHANRLHKAAAFVCPVAGIYVNVQGAQAKWTVVAGGISEALDLFFAAGADKSAVVFCESLDFRSDRSFRLGILPDFNIFIVLYHTFFLFSRPCYVF